MHFSFYNPPSETITHLRACENVYFADYIDILEKIPTSGAKEKLHLSILKPGGFIIPHIDAGNPFLERWQIPLQVAGMFWQDGEWFRIEKPMKIKQWLPHAVINNDNVDRIHLVYEVANVPEDSPKEQVPFSFSEMLPEVQELIRKVQPTNNS